MLLLSPPLEVTLKVVEDALAGSRGGRSGPRAGRVVWKRTRKRSERLRTAFGRLHAARAARTAAAPHASDGGADDNGDGGVGGDVAPSGGVGGGDDDLWEKAVRSTPDPKFKVVTQRRVLQQLKELLQTYLVARIVQVGVWVCVCACSVGGVPRRWWYEAKIIFIGQLTL